MRHKISLRSAIRNKMMHSHRVIDRSKVNHQAIRSRIIVGCLVTGFIALILFQSLKTNELFSLLRTSISNTHHSSSSDPIAVVSTARSTANTIGYNRSSNISVSSRSIGCMQSQRQSTQPRLFSSIPSSISKYFSKPQEAQPRPSSYFPPNPILRSPATAMNKKIQGPDHSLRIAFVVPTFTAAAYNHKGFYDFYRNHINDPSNVNVTRDDNLLKVKVCTPLETYTSNSAYAMLYLVNELKRTAPQLMISVLADQDVDQGGLVGSGNVGNAYDFVILGHQEYVTQREYENFRQFVARGGTLIILDGNIFYAEVSYDPVGGTIQLVKGHGWAFNGKSAWRSIGERWADETRQWVGSNYLCSSCTVKFGYNPFDYFHHEENYVSNSKDSIILNYDATITDWKSTLRKVIIATYELNYKKGKVIVLGLYCDDIIANKRLDNFFYNVLEEYGFRQNIKF